MRASLLPAEAYGEEATALAGCPVDAAAAAHGGTVVCLTAKGVQIVSHGKVVSTTPLAYDGTSGTYALPSSPVTLWQAAPSSPRFLHPCIGLTHPEASPGGWWDAVVAISPDGEEVAVGASDNGVYLFARDGDALRPTATLQRHRAPVTAVAFSPDGASLASVDAAKEALVWSRTTREVTKSKMVFHSARVQCVAWSPDSTRIGERRLPHSTARTESPYLPPSWLGQRCSRCWEGTCGAPRGSLRGCASRRGLYVGLQRLARWT
jgi:WD40 repeat protein